MSCDMFPGVIGDREIDNPAIRLFGLRFFNDQSPTELLVELLLVAASPKRIGETTFDGTFPSPETLSSWPHNEPLSYASRARLNLKLFSFMGASRLDTRHATHRAHYKELIEGLKAKVRVNERGGEDEVLRTLENLLLGFQGAGSGRTWCAQSFLPIGTGLLAGETLWNDKSARKEPPDTWEGIFDRLSKYLTMNQHRFLGRGGELLFLQLCNALRQDASLVKRWITEHKLALEPATEQIPGWVARSLAVQLQQLLDLCPATLTDIAEFIDTGADADTARKTDEKGPGEPRYVETRYCPVESWQEGYLFAVDLLRLCLADLDLVERLRLIESACSMQVLRSLLFQSSRHSPADRVTSWPGFRLAVTAREEDDPVVKRISRQTAKMAEKLIHDALRTGLDELPEDADFKEADSAYGGKLFVGLAKKIGFLVPRRGAGARFTLDERLLRLLVTTTVPVGGRLTYDRFKELVELRYGLVFDARGFGRASGWADGVETIPCREIDSWLQEMLEAAGLLIRLSDSCALVRNPAAARDTE